MNDVACHLELKEEMFESSSQIQTCIWLNLAQDNILGESTNIRVGSRIRIERRIILTRNKVMTNMGKESVLSRKET